MVPSKKDESQAFMVTDSFTKPQPCPGHEAAVKKEGSSSYKSTFPQIFPLELPELLIVCSLTAYLGGVGLGMTMTGWPV